MPFPVRRRVSIFLGISVFLALIQPLLAIFLSEERLPPLPWFVPAVVAFCAGATVSIALLCFGRLLFKKEPYALWVGLTFSLLFLTDSFYLLFRLGIVPVSPSTLAYLFYLFYLILPLPTLFFLTRAESAPVISRGALLRLISGASLLCLTIIWGIVLLEDRLPLLSLEARVTSFSRLIPYAFFFLYLGGIYLHWQRFRQTRAPLMGYFLGLLVISLGVFPGVIQSRGPYDVAWLSYYLFPTMGCALFYLALLLDYSDLYGELGEALNRMALIHRLNALVSSSLNLAEIYRTLSQEVKRIVPYDRLAVNILQKDENYLGAYTETSLPAAVPEGPFGKEEEGATRWAIDNRQLVICEDLLQDDRFPGTRKRYEKVGVRSYIILPLLAKGKVLGALNLGSRIPGLYTRKEVEILSPVAEILSLAIENAALYQESQRGEEIQRLLKELSQDITSLEIDSLLKKLTERVRDVLKIDIVDVRVMEQSSWRLKAVSGIEAERLYSRSPGEVRGRARWIIENRRPLAVSDITEAADVPMGESVGRLGVRGYLGAPFLSRGGEVIGVIRALTYQPREFAAEDVDLLQRLANGAAIALENARLLQELREKTAELESANRRLNRLLTEQSALREIFTQINFLDLGHLLRQLTERALTLLHVDHVLVRLMEKDRILRTVALAGEGAERHRQSTAGSGRGRSGWVLENRKPLAIKDISQDSAFGPGNIMRELGVKGYLCLPLISREQKAIGVLIAFSLAPREFTPEEISLAQQLAAGAAIAIENARLFEEVQKKSQELGEAFRTKSEFLNTMAHELRIPLNVIIGNTQLLEDGFYGPLAKKSRGAAAAVGKSARDLLHLLNEILDLARLEAKRVPLHIEEFPLREVIDDLNSSFVPLAKGKGLDLKVQMDSAMPALKSDRSKLTEVLQNLLANAVKYTDRGEVELRVCYPAVGGVNGGGWISFAVRDTGIGIQEESLPHLFEPFYIADGVDRKKYPGTGLGLSIVSNIVGLLKGKIQVESELGKGSTFTVALPLLHPDAASP